MGERSFILRMLKSLVNSQTNVFGTLRVTQAFCPHMVTARCGRIINIGSVAGCVAFPWVCCVHRKYVVSSPEHELATARAVLRQQSGSSFVD